MVEYLFDVILRIVFQQAVPSMCDDLIATKDLYMKAFEKVPESIPPETQLRLRESIAKVVSDDVKPAFAKLKTFIEQVGTSGDKRGQN